MRLDETYTDGDRTYVLGELLDTLDAIRRGRCSDELEKLVRSTVLTFLERAGLENDRVRQAASFLAVQTYNHFTERDTGGHPSYWNDSFYIANRFKLVDFDRRRSGIVVIWNGRHKYFEWETHCYGFDNAQLMADLGVISPDQISKFRMIGTDRSSGYYQFLPSAVERELMRKLQLTDVETCFAHLICREIWRKEKTNNDASGQYLGLPHRPEGV